MYSLKDVSFGIEWIRIYYLETIEKDWNAVCLNFKDILFGTLCILGLSVSVFGLTLRVSVHSVFVKLVSVSIMVCFVSQLMKVLFQFKNGLPAYPSSSHAHIHAHIPTLQNASQVPRSSRIDLSLFSHASSGLRGLNGRTASRLRSWTP